MLFIYWGTITLPTKKKGVRCLSCVIDAIGTVDVLISCDSSLPVTSSPANSFWTCILTATDSFLRTFGSMQSSLSHNDENDWLLQNVHCDNSRRKPAWSTKWHIHLFPIPSSARFWTTSEHRKLYDYNFYSSSHILQRANECWFFLKWNSTILQDLTLLMWWEFTYDIFQCHVTL